MCGLSYELESTIAHDKCCRREAPIQDDSAWQVSRGPEKMCQKSRMQNFDNELSDLRVKRVLWAQREIGGSCYSKPRRKNVCFLTATCCCLIGISRLGEPFFFWFPSTYGHQNERAGGR